MVTLLASRGVAEMAEPGPYQEVISGTEEAFPET